MFVSPVYVATVALLSLHSFVSASPLVARAGQGAVNPRITAPQAGDVWTVGSTQLVTWDTDEIPPSAANNTGTLILGYFDGHSSGENLDMDHPLASDFLLIDGCVRVEVPDVEPRDTYIVVLMGNSGNTSPEFTIMERRPTSATTSGSSSSSDKATVRKDPNDLKADPLLPGFPTTPVPPPPPASPRFSDSKIDHVDSKALSKDLPAPPLCKERSPSSNLATDHGPNERC